MSTVSMLNQNSSVASSALRSSGAGPTAEQTPVADDGTALEAPVSVGEKLVTISDAAQAVAGGKASEPKDFSQLSQDVRTQLDDQRAAAYANGSLNGAPSLSGLSSRALAAIILNRNSSFSQSEAKAAQREVLGRENGIFTQMTVSADDWTSGVAAYSRDVISRFDRMSSEEKLALGWADQTRVQAAAFVAQAPKPQV